MTFHSVLFGSEWVQNHPDDMPARKVMVAWYQKGICTDSQDNFTPTEFSSHIEVKPSGLCPYLIHGNYGNVFEEVFEDYKKRRV